MVERRTLIKIISYSVPAMVFSATLLWIRRRGEGPGAERRWMPIRRLPDDPVVSSEKAAVGEDVNHGSTGDIGKRW